MHVFWRSLFTSCVQGETNDNDYDSELQIFVGSLIYFRSSSGLPNVRPNLPDFEQQIITYNYNLL